MYGHSSTHAGALAGAAAGTPPFTGISLMWVLAIAIVLMVLGVTLRLVVDKTK